MNERNEKSFNKSFIYTSLIFILDGQGYGAFHVIMEYLAITKIKWNEIKWRKKTAHTQ